MYKYNKYKEQCSKNVLGFPSLLEDKWYDKSFTFLPVECWLQTSLISAADCNWQRLKQTMKHLVWG